ncbi:hypothetical protein FB451DRAFT_1205328 [Mycena latifolia]|nr:hypothetical protein FB451DRAFT_1205328 [Mycena latifolia]
MRCIWSTTARNAFHILAGRSPALSYGRVAFSRAAYRPPRSTGQLVFPTAMRVSATSAALSYSHNIAADAVSLGDAIDAVPESSTSLPNLLVKPSKISFAAAQAIRLCVGNGGVTDGFFVLNSIRYAAYRARPSTLPFKMPGMLQSKIEFEAAALQFGPNVSQRLPAHALLHSLVRLGLAEPAFELAKMMMAEGVVIRSTTLEVVIQSLVSPAEPPAATKPRFPFTSPSPAIPLKLASDVLWLRPSIMADQRTRLALKLLFLARRHRQRRTDTMFKLIMAASLLHGELIIFSLLFGWTCRDWQTAYSLESNLASIPDDDELQSSSQVIAARHRWAHLRSETIIPDRESMDSALSMISTILERRSESWEPTHDRLVALQALGNLAGLLDRRQIPFPQIAPLLRTMYKCPRVEDEIWIVGAGGCPERIKAYEYFHRIIYNLIYTLPTEHPRLRPPDPLVKSHYYDMLPPLELADYNTLLHYALRHRLSPALGEMVLSHMMKQRWVPIAPDTTTANILLRSWTLMRRYDIAAEVLESMGTVTLPPYVPAPPRPNKYTVPQSATLIRSGPMSPVRTEPETVPDHTRWGEELGRIGREKLKIPLDLPSEADVYTLTSYISYLTSTGQAGAVKDLLFRVIPELHRPRYYTMSELNQDQRCKACGAVQSPLSRDSSRARILYRCAKCAVQVRPARACGPHLAASEEGGTVQLGPPSCPECEPWIFGPHVYTVMLDCYGALVRRRQPWVLKLDPNKRVWSSTSRNTIWAAFMYKCQRQPKPLSRERVQFLLRRYMRWGALSVFRRFINLPLEYERVPQLRKWLAQEDLPRPDARFFNAALQVFRPPMPPQQKSWYEGQLRHAQYTMDRYGAVPPNEGWNRHLHEVVEHMLDNRFPLPLGLQPLFVGRLESVNPPAVERPDHGPYAYGRDEHRSFQRYRLPTPKERGLPVSRGYHPEVRARRKAMRREKQRRLQS